ncbi:MAG: type II toxin-antitoxin system VapB family antitoxin [Polaromonas sp.]|nr:type II toxin-antitoxin system VapB family antitoxin [Polaromonas sp.]
MRIKIEIDEKLISAAMAAGDFKTPKDAIEEGLRRIARSRIYQDLRDLRGKVRWGLDGDWTSSSNEIPVIKSGSTSSSV